MLLGTLGGPYAAFVCCTIYYNTILAVSLWALMRARIFSLGHAAFLSLGTYTGFLAITFLHLPFGMAVLAGAVVAAATAFLTGLPMLRLKGLYFAIGSILLVEVVRHLMSWLKGLTGGVEGMSLKHTPTLFGIRFVEVNAQYLFLVIAGMITYFFYRILRSQYGYLCQGTGENEDLSSSIGVKCLWYQLSLLTLTAFIAGGAGALWGGLIRFISPDSFTFYISVFIFVNVLIGGVQNVLGPVIGTVFLTFLTEPLRELAHFQTVAYGAALLVTILFLPDGLLSLLKPRKQGLIGLLEKVGLKPSRMISPPERDKGT